MATPPRLARWLRSPWFWAAVALVTRVLWLLLGPGRDVGPYSDSVDYHRLAAHLAAGRGFTLGLEDALYPTTFRPPLMPALTAAVYAVFGPHYVLSLLLQIALSALTVPLASRLARETLGGPAALLTAPLVALWPTLAFLSTTLGTETLTILLTAAALLLAVRTFARGGAALALAAGAGLGLAALARPTALPLAAVLALGLVGLAPRPLARRGLDAALLVLGLLFCVLPWTLRNHAVTGRWI
ncbi:MAG: glycosyltransferase family 39 protein, partial [Candidatus Eisenbacteria bacterium]